MTDHERWHATHGCLGRCGTRVELRLLACPTCWARLPEPLRHDVTTTYQQRRHDPIARWIQAVVAAYRWYQDNPREDTDA